MKNLKTINRNSSLAALFLACLLTCSQLFGYDGNQPIDLEADDLQMDNNTGVLTYTGNVKLTQGEMILTADTLKIYTIDKKVNKIEAFGDLAELQDRRPDGSLVKAKALELLYDVSSETIQLTGNGTLDHQSNTMHSESIFYDLTTQNLQAGGTGRVTTVIQPGNATIK